MLLSQFCTEKGMLVNTLKTKFFAIHASARNREPFSIVEMEVQWCNRYVYLGSVFMSDGSLHSAIAAHTQTKTRHVLKFVSFVDKNRDIPFYVKKKIFEAAFYTGVSLGLMGL